MPSILPTDHCRLGSLVAGQVLALHSNRLGNIRCSPAEEGRTSYDCPGKGVIPLAQRNSSENGQAMNYLVLTLTSWGICLLSGKGNFTNIYYNILLLLCHVLRQLQPIHATCCLPYLDHRPFFWSISRPVQEFPPLAEVITNFLRIYKQSLYC